jgi:hypothetical protein
VELVLNAVSEAEAHLVSLFFKAPVRVQICSLLGDILTHFEPTMSGMLNSG